MPDDPAPGGPVLLFDGVCNLCNGAIRFVVRHDPEGRFRFAPLQSAVGRRLLADCDLPAGAGDGGTRSGGGNGVGEAERGGDGSADALETMVLVEGGRCYAKSDAALRVARRLGLPWAALWPLRVVPRRLRDAVYDFVAARRYRWFGRRETCMVPSPELAERFLD